MSSPIDVAAGLVFHGGHLLLTQRRLGDHLGGLWEFPGGKREEGESMEGALKRELREELGVEVEVGACFAKVDHAYPDRAVHIEFFLCRLISGVPKPIACAGLAWARPADFARYEFPPADAQVLGALTQNSALWEGGL